MVERIPAASQRTGCVYVAELNGETLSITGLLAEPVAFGIVGLMAGGVTETAGNGAIIGADGATLGV